MCHKTHVRCLTILISCHRLLKGTNIKIIVKKVHLISWLSVAPESYCQHDNFWLVLYLNDVLEFRAELYGFTWEKLDCPSKSVWALVHVNGEDHFVVYLRWSQIYISNLFYFCFNPVQRGGRSRMRSDLRLRGWRGICPVRLLVIWDFLDTWKVNFLFCM